MPFSRSMRLGPYELTELIGAGGMGEVYRAWDTRLERNVAVKVLAERLASEQQALARFRVEPR
jgi:serine/threonine protein kinase